MPFLRLSKTYNVLNSFIQPLNTGVPKKKKTHFLPLGRRACCKIILRNVMREFCYISIYRDEHSTSVLFIATEAQRDMIIYNLNLHAERINPVNP